MSDIAAIGALLVLVNIGCFVCLCRKPAASRQYSKVAISTDCDSDSEAEVLEDTAVATTRKGNGCSALVVTIFVLLALLLGAFLIHYFQYFDYGGVQNVHVSFNKPSPSVPQLDAFVDAVLPNTKLNILLNTDAVYSGEFVVTDLGHSYRWNFEITGSPGDWSRLRFFGEGGQRWKGISVYYDEGSLHYDLTGVDGVDASVLSSPAGSSLNDGELFESFVTDVIAEHLVQLSIKTGSLGNTATHNVPYFTLHQFAKWIFRYAMAADDSAMDRWSYLNEPMAQTNEIIGMMYGAGDDKVDSVPVRGGSRSLMQVDDYQCYSEEDPPPTCGSPICKCHNACYGQCGPGESSTSACECWKWLCITCECHQYCYDHDYYCSCLGEGDWGCNAAAFDAASWSNCFCHHHYSSWISGDPHHAEYQCNTDCSDKCDPEYECEKAGACD
mmetsp:Transcript_23457/g.37547  ORF Transcript_23457/g.37547 Transcript_23457/m.37547 type:complete len:441 (+) Transcript_23457:84-1406(+)